MYIYFIVIYFLILCVQINLFHSHSHSHSHGNVLVKWNIYVRYEIPECRFMFYFLCFLDDCCNVHNLLLFMLDIV